MNNMKFILLILVLGLATSGLTYAKQTSRFRTSKSKPSSSTVTRADFNTVREGGKTIIYKKKNVVDFDDSLIEGELKNPNEFYFVHRPEEKFGSLVKKRPNFNKEMLRDSVMIR